MILVLKAIAIWFALSFTVTGLYGWAMWRRNKALAAREEMLDELGDGASKAHETWGRAC